MRQRPASYAHIYKIWKPPSPTLEEEEEEEEKD
jgi:hypothetical protein